MAVLVEALSVVIKCSSVEATYRGGVRAFADFCRRINATFCSDGELARVGFGTHDEVKRFIGKLNLFGLVYLRSGACIDIVVADQRGGLLHACDWAIIGLAELPGGPHVKVAACRFAGSKLTDVTVPAGWRFATSLSAKTASASVESPRSRPKGLAVFADRPGSATPLPARLGLHPKRK